MTYAVRVTDDYVGLMGSHVVEGQMIVPGVPLLDVMTPEGLVKTIISEGWGVVAHVEGEHIFSNPDDEPTTSLEQENEEDEEGEQGGRGTRRGGGGSNGFVFSKGEVICHIVAREQHGTRKTGLHPRPAPSVRLRRSMGLGGG